MVQSDRCITDEDVIIYLNKLFDQHQVRLEVLLPTTALVLLDTVQQHIA